MAITIVSQPNRDQIPVYTYYIPYVVSSTLNTQNDFRYVFDIFTRELDISPFTNFEARTSTFPRENGNGVFSPHTFLQSKVGETTLNPFISSFIGSTSSYHSFQLKLYEQWNPSIFYNTIVTGTQTQLSIATGSFGNPSNLNLSVGDIIFIDPLEKLTNSGLFGTSSILSITVSGSASLIRIDKDTTGVTTIEQGFINEVFRFDSTTSTKDIVNFTEQYLEYGQNLMDNFIMTLGGLPFDLKYFLSEHREQRKYVYESEYETLSLLMEKSYGSEPARTLVNINVLDNNFVSLQTLTYSLPFGPARQPRIDIGIGYQNIKNLATSLGLTLSASASNWQVDITQGGETASFGMTYSLITQCKEYELKTLAFKNKLGGIDYFTFNLLSRYNSNVNRTIMNKNLPYDFTAGDRGRKIIDQSVKEVWTLNTRYLTDYEALFIRELIESVDVYLLEGVKLIPIIIQDSSYQLKTSFNDQLIQYTITFEKSIDINTNI